MQGLRRVAVEELGKVEAELAREAREDVELRERHGSAWHRPSSAALNSTLMEKIAGAGRIRNIYTCVLRIYNMLGTGFRG